MNALVDTATISSVARAVDALSRHLAADEFARDVSLASLGRWRIGGPADLVVTPRSAGALALTLSVIGETRAPHVVIGDGSNLLFDDAGFRGLVIRMGRAFRELRFEGEGVVEAGAGWWVPSFVRRLIDAGLSGAVHAIGIPGTLGGLVTMNGGSQRKGIGENVLSVDVVEPDGTQRRIKHAELGYSYRASRLQQGGAIVTAVRFRFEPGERSALRREAISILASRRAKFPRVRANCGSVFVSDPKLYSLIGPPGLAIERAGLKGYAIGDAQFSPDHANFIVNNARARSADVLALIGLARNRVHELTGIAMAAEVRHLAPDGTLRPAHEVAPALSHLSHGQEFRP